jgi:hypothetical protein
MTSNGSVYFYPEERHKVTNSTRPIRNVARAILMQSSSIRTAPRAVRTGTRDTSSLLDQQFVQLPVQYALVRCFVAAESPSWCCRELRLLRRRGILRGTPMDTSSYGTNVISDNKQSWLTSVVPVVQSGACPGRACNERRRNGQGQTVPSQAGPSRAGQALTIAGLSRPGRVGRAGPGRVRRVRPDCKGG